MSLTPFFSMFLFNPPENISKQKVFSDVFTGIKKEHWEEKGQKPATIITTQNTFFSVWLLLTKTLVLSVHSKIPIGVIHRP